MPYIRKLDRPPLDKLVQQLSSKIDSTGDLNYVITSLLHHEVNKQGKNYENLNRLEGVIGCVGKEFYRTVSAPYEYKKSIINGDLNIIKEKE